MNHQKEILIVEDNVDNCILAEKILNFYGYKTVVRGHGAAALDYCESHSPDLILMDLSLPDIDGIEIARLLRKQENHQHTPIIAVTAHAIPGFKEMTEEAGMNDFLTKPFMPNELVDIVKKHI